MSDPLYVATAEIERVSGLHRTATLASGPTIDFGVHGPIRAHYGLHDGEDRPLPVDYVTASAGG